jgi:DNA-binding transcriptional ArsR family regulator
MAEENLIEALKALAHPLRWRILTTLAARERNVGEIEQATGIVQPGLSQQLGVLRKAGLVDTRKDAKLVYYSVARGALTEITATMASLAPASANPAAEAASLRSAAHGVANFARMS